LDFEAIGGLQDLQHAVTAMPVDFTRLVLPIEDNDPDEAYSTVAYEKGFNLLLYLERKVGTKKFERFFQSYIKHFASKTVSSNEFRKFFVEHFEKDKVAKAAIVDVDWDAWYHAPGMPPVVVDFDRSLSEASERLARLWLAVDRSGSYLPLENVKGWSSGQLQCFLDALCSQTEASNPLKPGTLKAMNALYSFGTSMNAEILLRYCRLAIDAEDESVLPIVLRFITSQGRMKFIRPLYKALFESKMGKNVAVQTFLEHQDFYQ
jgi:leukotriene-A4 hydrolase